MAHRCPECSAICRCRGDIDDLILDMDEDVAGCIHPDECDPDGMEPDWDETEAAQGEPAAKERAPRGTAFILAAGHGSLCAVNLGQSCDCGAQEGAAGEGGDRG